MRVTSRRSKRSCHGFARMSDLEVEKLVVFCRELRAHGLSVTPAEIVTATTALQIIDKTDREEVFLSLRSILTTSVDDFTIFEEVFKKFWNSSRSLSTSTACLLYTS